MLSIIDVIPIISHLFKVSVGVGIKNILVSDDRIFVLGGILVFRTFVYIFILELIGPPVTVKVDPIIFKEKILFDSIPDELIATNVPTSIGLIVSPDPTDTSPLPEELVIIVNSF